MTKTSFRLTDELKKNLYKGYMFQGGEYTEIPFDFLGDYPAGQLLSTATDFSRFMMCHLNDGLLDSARVLKPETAGKMHSTQFTHHPKLNGSVGFTFHISQNYGNKISSHNGGYLGLSTRMWLLPGLDVGIFMATNVMDFSIIESVIHPFMQTFFDNTRPKPGIYPLDSLPEFDPGVEKFTGWYRSTRYSHMDMTKMGLLAGFGGEVHLWKNDSGMLQMHDHKGDVRRLIQVEQALFRSIDDDYYIAFLPGENGEPNFLFTHGTGALEKIPAFYTIKNQRIIIGSILGAFFLLLLARLLYLIFPKRFKRQKPLPANAKSVKQLTNWSAGLFLLHWVTMGLVLFVLNPPYELMVGMAYGMPALMYVVQLIPLAAVATLVLAAIRFIRGLGSNAVSTGGKIFYGFFILISLLYIWLLNYWNLLGYQFG